MNLKNFEIPERCGFNFIYFEMIDSYLEDKYGVKEDKYLGELWKIMRDMVNLSINQERARWVGAILRANEDD